MTMHGENKRNAPQRAALVQRAAVIIALATASIGCAKRARDPAREAAPAVVMIMTGDWRDGRLVPLSAGSGTIVSTDGAVLTSRHLLYDEARGELHDRFVIARVPPAHDPAYDGDAPGEVSTRTPRPICSGRPANGVHDAALDLAVIRCDQDMTGKPLAAGEWPAIAIGRPGTPVPGEPVWILGYPRSGDGALAVSTGPITGWTGEHGGPGQDFLTTRAAVSPGVSGGAVVNRNGALVGVATGYRVRTRISAVGAMPVGRIGLVRPVDRARHLLEVGQDFGPSPHGGNPALPLSAVKTEASTK